MGRIRGAARHRRLTDKTARIVKYAIAAPAVAFLIGRTSWLDGTEGAPPRFLNYAADGDFRVQGTALVRDIRREVPLNRETRLLDIGCGIGRLAMALARDGGIGTYAGFDPVRYGILWCRKSIPDPRFTFDHADIRNSFYNPFGRVPPEDYTFPYPDRSFDLAVAISVFTHMPEAQSRRYFAEAMRCLDIGGRAYFTTFLPERLRDGAVYGLSHAIGAARVERLEEPDLAVGYARAFWEGLASDHGAVLEKAVPGSWNGEAGLPDFQDVMIFRRVA